MDAEALISAVFKQLPVWDKREKNHSNRNVVEKCWKKIAEEVNIQDVPSLKRKWKYIRDQFAVELGKIKPPRSGDPADSICESKWLYFHQLLFLKDTVKPRTSKGNYSDVQPSQNAAFQNDFSMGENSAFEIITEENENQLGSENEPEINAKNSNDTDVVLPSTSTATPKRKRSSTESFNAAMVNIEKQKLELLKAKKEKSQNDDEDMLFFKSLLPHVHKIPPNLKLQFRNRMQDIVSSFAYPQVASLPQISPAPSSVFSYTSSISDCPAQSYNTENSINSHIDVNTTYTDLL